MQRLSAAEVLSLHEKLLADLLSGTMLQQERGPSHDLYPLTHPPLPWVYCHYLHQREIDQF